MEREVVVNANACVRSRNIGKNTEDGKYNYEMITLMEEIHPASKWVL